MALKITFEDHNTGKTLSVKAQKGEKLTQAAFRAGVQIKQSCGGSPSCADCKITVKNGDDSQFEAAEGAELRLLGNVYFITKERLACQAIIKQDSHVIIPQYGDNTSKRNERFKQYHLERKAREQEKNKGSKKLENKKQPKESGGSKGKKENKSRPQKRSKKNS